MHAMDVDWALYNLRNYVYLKERIPLPKDEQKPNLKTRARGTREQLRDAELVVQAIARAFYSKERVWVDERVAERLIWELTHGEEVRQRLGVQGPSPALDAHGLHPWVWDAAAPHWLSDNHRAALWAAAVNVNSRTQRKVGRHDLGEGKLLDEVFGIGEPSRGRPRLRLTDRRNPEHFKDIHLGASSLGKGLYSAVRNPVTHISEEDHDLSPAEALEALAGFSLLARWIDRAEVETVDEPAADSVENRTPVLES